MRLLKLYCQDWSFCNGTSDWFLVLFRCFVLTFGVLQVTISQMNRQNYSSRSVHLFHVGKMRMKLCRGWITKARDSYSVTMQVSGWASSFSFLFFLKRCLENHQTLLEFGFTITTRNYISILLSYKRKVLRSMTLGIPYFVRDSFKHSVTGKKKRSGRQSEAMCNMYC